MLLILSLSKDHTVTALKLTSPKFEDIIEQGSYEASQIKVY
jgi:hypothetical protein